MYSVGEASCVSVHGANRLGANSLLDLVVFGRGTGKNIIDKVKNNKISEMVVDENSFEKSLSTLEELTFNNNNNSSSSLIREKMQEGMQKYSSVYKSKELLEKGFDIMKGILYEKINIVDTSLIWNTDLLEALELRNMRSLAFLTVGASLFREESREVIIDMIILKEMMKIGCTASPSWLNKDKLINKKSKVNSEGLYPTKWTQYTPAKRVY